MAENEAERLLARVLNTILQNDGAGHNPYSRPGVKEALTYLNKHVGITAQTAPDEPAWCADDWKALLITHEPKGPPVLEPGCLAFYDTFSGLVPCKVHSIRNDETCTIVLTATRKAYKKGETLQIKGGVVPRSAVRVRSGQYRIGSFKIQPEEWPTTIVRK